MKSKKLLIALITFSLLISGCSSINGKKKK